MENLQLILTTPIEELVPAMIGFNADELVARVTEMTEQYKTAHYSEDTVKQAKEDRAKLNKFRKAINDERISIGKIYGAPYEKFKGEIDRICAVIDSANKNIEGQLDAFEQARISKRRELLRQHYLVGSAELGEIIGYEKIENKTWLNASISDKKAKEQVDIVIAGLRNDIETIKQLQSEDIDELLLFYYNNLSLALTLRENEARKERARRVEEMRQKREKEEEQKRIQQLEEEQAKRTLIEAANASDQAPNEIPPEFIPPAEPQTVIEPKTMSIRFEVTGTVEQLKALQQFIKENHLSVKEI